MRKVLFISRWWNKDTVAVVTGANKGIGFEIARALAKQGITTVLTARDEDRGKKAVEALKREGLDNVIFHPLDVQSEESSRNLAQWLSQNYGGIDILVSKTFLWSHSGQTQHCTASSYTCRFLELFSLGF